MWLHVLYVLCAVSEGARPGQLLPAYVMITDTPANPGFPRAALGWWNGLGPYDAYSPWLDAGNGTNSSIAALSYITNRQTQPGGLDCNPYNVPAASGWTHPPRCKLPCVQYAALDEPYFWQPALPNTKLLKPMCPCTNGSVYSIPRDYTSVIMSE